MSTIMETQQSAKECCAEQQVYQSVQRRLASCSYSFVFCKVTWDFDGGRLTLRGCVPSFYLKEVLQELLRDIEHVEQISNEVDVVSSYGLSSVGPNKPR